LRAAAIEPGRDRQLHAAAIGFHAKRERGHQLRFEIGFYEHFNR